MSRRIRVAGYRSRATPAKPQPVRWRKKAPARVFAALGMILLSFLTGLVVKYGDLNYSRWSREVGIATPVHVSATQGHLKVGEVPLVRVLPAGVGAAERELLSGHEWLNNPGVLGIAVGLDVVRIIVQAKESRVLLVGLRLQVDEKRPALDSTLLFMGTQGGPGKPIPLRFDLDAPGADVGRGIAARNAQGRDHFAGENYELDPGQSVEFRATVTTRQCYCRWHFEVEVSVDGKEIPVPVRQSDGSPFELTAANPQVKEVYSFRHPSDPPVTVLDTIGSWTGVSPAEFCARQSICDPTDWPAR